VVEARNLDRELAALLTHIREAPSLFYQRRFAESGKRDTVGLTDIALTRRDEILQDQLDHLPHGTRRFADAAAPVRVGVTGTGDSLLVLAWSVDDLRRERAAGARVLAHLGVRPGMRVANALPGALATPGSLLLGDVIEDIGALDVPLGSIDSEAAARQAWELVDRVRPEILILDAGSAASLFTGVPNGQRTWWQGIVWVRTDMPTAPAPTMPPPQAGFAGWQRAWLAVPEATCFAAYSCAASRFHVDDQIVAEIADVTTGAVAPAGRAGTLVVTPFGFDTPLLRYISALQARAVSACTCGEGGTVLELT